MPRDKHPNKEIEAALQYAESKNWRVEKSKGKSAHAWGRVYCPTKDNFCINTERCITSIWSTPRNAVNHARLLKKMVDRCLDLKEKQKANEDE